MLEKLKFAFINLFGEEVYEHHVFSVSCNYAEYRDEYIDIDEYGNMRKMSEEEVLFDSLKNKIASLSYEAPICRMDVVDDIPF